MIERDPDFGQKKTRRLPTFPPRSQGSIIGMEGLNFWVRYVTRCGPFIMVAGDNNADILSVLLN